ncbi:hypothetical protein [Treponema denticola]|uniref:hypothetical protein n=1 Tax=Treponema denticola TaxID=158 RepID=UPI0002B4F2D9|nr:hypothetical protein [Treponema denticola]EMB26470.1 hypothetical protein HMPREF9724_00447 [Treponema denticola SP37]
MIDKCIDSSYNHSHQKSAKSFAKLLDIRPHVGQNSQLHSFTASQLHSFTASQLHSFTASQLHSFTASQLHSFTAEGKLCPNKITYATVQIFSANNTHGTGLPFLCVFYSMSYWIGTNSIQKTEYPEALNSTGS